MKDWTRVLLHGTFDGFTYSTDDLPRIVVVLDDGERVEVPKECVIIADQMVNKNKIKLKDVIARIKSFDVGAKEVWLNEILNELGSDYGTLKYKAGYDQGKFEGEYVGQQLKDADKIRQELNKPVVPQFVADWIEKNRGSLFGLNYDSVSSEIYDWVYEEEEGNLKKLHLACAIGYTVEKEKRYLVKMKGVEDIIGFLNFGGITKTWFMGDEINSYGCRTHHTRKELEEAGFGWVFSCEGIEIEEVEE